MKVFEGPTEKGQRTIRVVEELTKKGWKVFDPSDIEKQPDGEFDLTLRVRTLKPAILTKRCSGGHYFRHDAKSCPTCRSLRKPKKMR